MNTLPFNFTPINPQFSPMYPLAHLGNTPVEDCFSFERKRKILEEIMKLQALKQAQYAGTDQRKRIEQFLISNQTFEVGPKRR